MCIRDRITARFFYDTLTKTPEGKAGLEYLYNRKISNKTIITYGLGYAADKYDALLGYMRSKGFRDEELAEAGVVVMSNGKIYDRFFGRVMSVSYTHLICSAMRLHIQTGFRSIST